MKNQITSQGCDVACFLHQFSMIGSGGIMTSSQATNACCGVFIVVNKNQGFKMIMNKNSASRYKSSGVFSF